MIALGSALIVDDDDDVRELMSTVLDAAGFRTAAVAGGGPALALAEQHGAPDVYVMDVRMPEMSGHELCRQLKAGERTQAPVLIVSADSSAADVAAAFDAGCDDFLAKPFRIGDLLDKIEKLIQSAESAGAATQLVVQ